MRASLIQSSHLPRGLRNNLRLPRCDEVRSDGTTRTIGEARATYTSATKMRSAVTYLIGRGANTPWNSDDGIHYRGNPSLSVEVSRYMLTLKKCKVCFVFHLDLVFFKNILQHALGARAMGSLAVTSDMINEMYAIKSPPNQILLPVPQACYKDRGLDNWRALHARDLVHVVTVLAFVCLLRSDETLNLKRKDECISPDCVRINVTYMKTSPCGRSFSFQ